MRTDALLLYLYCKNIYLPVIRGMHRPEYNLLCMYQYLSRKACVYWEGISVQRSLNLTSLLRLEGDAARNEGGHGPDLFFNKKNPDQLSSPRKTLQSWNQYCMWNLWFLACFGTFEIPFLQRHFLKRKGQVSSGTMYVDLQGISPCFEIQLRLGW